MSVKPQHKRLGAARTGRDRGRHDRRRREKSFDISENAWTSAGETADPEGSDHMLVEIKSSE
ncbi:hypothetical protein [Streptomyces sp. C3-3]|uniref:hypothetical protein n=1 Tax=Streptomyces sp. C3-3 TaxID=2824901 RepID=UPI001B36B0DB|nr:hypothetical protein [Streptomyces sp. C3-3]MBQ1111598.1 hypothetical protein [Streptomyces sp. C3-3]